MKKILIIIFWITTSTCVAQTVRIIDKNTQVPMSGTVISSKNPNLSVVTDAQGKADISEFKTADSIHISFVGYQPVTYNYGQLETMSFMVEIMESNISLDEVVISSNRWEQNEMEVPQRIEKISRKDVAFQNPQTAADLLGSGGSAYIQKSQLAGGSPIIRGFATNRVMLVVDGVRMNNAIFRTGNLQNVISLDANAVESAEILFGPGSVMYGSDAIGGVMDFHTLQPQVSVNGKTLVTGNVLGRYSTANTEKTGHLDFNIGLKKLAFTTSVSFSDYGDLRTGSNGNAYFLRPDYQEVINGVDSFRINDDPQVQVHSGYSQYNILQKVRLKPNENWDFEYAFHYSATSDAPRYDRLYLKNGAGVFTNAEWYYGPQKWMMNRVGVQHNKSNAVYDKLRLVVALQDYEESRHDRRTGNANLRTQTESVNAFSLNLDLDKKLSEKSNLFYGVEIVDNKIGSVAQRENIQTGAITPTNTRYPDGSTWKSYAGYVNYKHHLSSKLILNAGLRYSQFMIEATFDTSTFAFPFTTAENKHGALNGSLGLVYRASDTWQLYLNGSTGFRSPNIDDIGKVFESEPGSVVVPNTDLKPEYAYNAEIGTAKVFGNYLKLDISAYYTLLDNALARRNFVFNGQDSIMYDGQLSQVQAIQNITKANVYGVQAGIEIYFGRGISMLNVINYLHGEEQSEDSLKYYPLRHGVPFNGSSHIIYERKKLKLDLYVNYNAKMDYEDLALSERTDNAPYAKDANGLPFVPGWYTLNFKAAWFINKNFSLNAGVENITDQLYRPFASGISAPGRNFIVALHARF